MGVGSPILLPLLAALGGRGTFLATDSTAPIKDAAVARTTSLYVDEPAPMKLKAYRIAEVWLDGGPGFRCQCPHCRAALSAHPFRLDKARAWWRSEGKRALGPGDLWAPGPLAELLPLLGMPKAAKTRRTVVEARIGHNHWILERIERAAARHSTSLAKLCDWVASTVDRHVQASTAPA